MGSLPGAGGAQRQPMDIEYGWSFMEKGIAKLKGILDGEDKINFEPQQYMNLYTTIYNMCTQKPPHDYSEQLYNRYRDAFSYYIVEKVLPALKEHRDEFLLKELHKRWDNHKVMVRWLSRFFTYLDRAFVYKFDNALARSALSRYYIARHSLSSLQDVGLLRFRDEVYMELKGRAKDAVLMAIEKERDGEQIDRVLLKNVLAIFIEVGMGGNECYENDFETDMLTASAEHYNRTAAAWVESDSCPDYMLKAEDCLKQSSSASPGASAENTKLTFWRRENSGCAALLNDDKWWIRAYLRKLGPCCSSPLFLPERVRKEDLARMYRLFNRVPKGLEPVADIFKKHVESEGMKLVKEVTGAWELRKEKEKEKEGKVAREGGNAHEQQQCQHMAAKSYNSSFTAIGYMGIGCMDVSLGSSEKLSDQAIEETYEKLVKLLAYISDKDLFAEFYRKKLATTSALRQSASDEHERLILTRLKQQCGAQFTSKLSILGDHLIMACLLVAWSCSDSVVRCLGQRPPTSFHFVSYFHSYLDNDYLVIGHLIKIMLLAYNLLGEQAVDLVLPKEMADGVEAFRVIFGALALDIKTLEIELVLSTFQASLLLLFNNG
eukprot:jgi/Botrbrau1/19530/Bobra.0035s0026.1